MASVNSCQVLVLSRELFVALSQRYVAIKARQDRWSFLVCFFLVFNV